MSFISKQPSIPRNRGAAERAKDRGANAGKNQALKRDRYKLSRFQKLLNRRDFRIVYQEGQRFTGKRLTLFYLTGSSSHTRLGITITKKWGKAHERNRFKRVSREAFRKIYPALPKGLTINVHPKDGYRDLVPDEVEAELKNLVSYVKTKPASAKGSQHN